MDRKRAVLIVTMAALCDGEEDSKALCDSEGRSVVEASGGQLRPYRP